MQSPESEKRTGWDRLCQKLGIKKAGGGGGGGGGISSHSSSLSTSSTSFKPVHHQQLQLPPSLCAAADMLATEMTDQERSQLVSALAKDAAMLSTTSPEEAKERVKMLHKFFGGGEI